MKGYSIIFLLSFCGTALVSADEWKDEREPVLKQIVALNRNFKSLEVFSNEIDNKIEKYAAEKDENVEILKKLQHENENEIKMLKNTLTIKQTIIDKLKMNDEKMEAQIHLLKNKVDETSKRFQCRFPFIGEECSSCAPGYFGYPSCRACSCNSNGSADLSCNNAGECTCKPNFIGDKCSSCLTGYAGANCDQGLPSQCSNYKILNEATRNHKSKMSGKAACDKEGISTSYYDLGDFKGPGWYRMMEPAGTKMPEQPPTYSHCGTHATGWLNGSHPSQIGERVTREVCFNYGKKCYEKTTITIINCSGFFIYNLPNTPGCSNRYCAN